MSMLDFDCDFAPDCDCDDDGWVVLSCGGGKENVEYTRSKREGAAVDAAQSMQDAFVRESPRASPTPQQVHALVDALKNTKSEKNKKKKKKKINYTG